MFKFDKQPKYKIGQKVLMNIKTSDTHTGLSFNNEVEFLITGIKAGYMHRSHGVDDYTETYLYGLIPSDSSALNRGQDPLYWILEKDVVVK